MLKIR